MTLQRSDRTGIELVFSEDDAYRAEISNLRDDFAVAAALVCAREGIDPDICEVSITFETEDGIRALNAQYREKDAVTDVLSFPMYESADEIREVQGVVEGQWIPGQARDDRESGRDDSVISLGDVVICPDVARRQAEEYGHSERREFVYLFVHSMLHLLGYDHEGEGLDPGSAPAMRAAEEDILQQIGLERRVL
ncbi:MAG: rRNA maturation RNase YbeY [Clostridiales Family XIII bacterium]|jgi:probable rRNA maturation factor|nr:rRNA maturation RNase YbeY [Clostridiales Family XIII bacterium]